MEPVRGYNIYKTGYSASQLMVYFEKHGMLDIIQKLFLKTIHERPVDVRKFIAENIRSVAAEVQSTNTVVLLPPVFDIEDLVKTFKNFYNIPTVIYTKKRKPGDTKEILEKYQKFLRHYKWERKHKIFLNYPKTCKEVTHLKGTNFNPNTVIEVRHGFQIPFKTREMLEEEGANFITDFKEVGNFYKEIYSTVHFASRAECDPNKERFHQTVHEIVAKLVTMMRNTTPQRLDHANGRYCHRVVIFGRRGSGRKTQAMALAKRYELVYINTEELIAEYLSSPCGLGEFLREMIKDSSCGLEESLPKESKGSPCDPEETKENQQLTITAVASAVYKRILQKDSITNGWVIVGFPYDLEGFHLMDKFIVPPNKIIVLHCRERVAMRRIAKRADYIQRCKCVKLDCCKPLEKFSIIYVKEEMAFFNSNKRPILEYLANKKETIHIDGNHSFSTVKTNIWARIEQDQHNIGFSLRPN